MAEMAAKEAKTRFGELLDTAQREPVVIKKHGRDVAVVISAKDYKEIETKDTNNNVNKAEYFIEKIYEFGESKLCVKQLGFSKGKAINTRVGCVTRSKPSVQNLIVMPGEGSDYNQGRIKAVFVENKVQDAPCNGFGGENRCITVSEPAEESAEESDEESDEESTEELNEINGVKYVKIISGNKK